MSLIEAVKRNDMFLFNSELADIIRKFSLQPSALQPLAVQQELNKQDMYGWSALHYAFALGHQNMVGALVQKGANLELLSKENDTPINISGIIFKRMNCLSVVESNISKNFQYQLLKTYSAEAQKIRSNNQGRGKYFRFAKLARDFVYDASRIMPINTSLTCANFKLVDTDQDLRHAQNIERIFKDLNHPDGFQLLLNYLAEKKFIRNCGTYNAVAYTLCRNVFGIRKVDAFSLGTKNVNRIALVLGRDDVSSENFRSWGENSVVCDVWEDSVFKSSEMDKKYRFSSQADEKIEFISRALQVPYQSKNATIQPLLSMYHQSRKIMMQELKIKTLESIASYAYSNDREAILEVVEHKKSKLGQTRPSLAKL